ncbi:MAG: PAS domain S-box protein [Chloroflexi bacterium]|nr:PAS domain S-box protein [Chloroflexota bacterium]
MPRPLRVLMVEDSENDASLILRQLTRTGYAVEHERVETAAQMQAALQASSWEIIMADYSLPHFTGPAALDLLIQSGLDIPFIVVSGEITDEIAVALMKAGAQDYLSKDNLARLAPVLERELAQARKRQEHRIAEEAVKNSELRYRTLIEQASDGIFIADPQGNLVDVNPSACAMLGYTREEILKLNLIELVTFSERVIEPFFLDELKMGQVVLSQRRLQRKDGWLLPVEISGKMLPDGRLQGIVRDISERKQVEEKLQNTLRQLNFHIENTPLAVVQFDSELNITYWSGRAQEMFGWTAREVLDKHIDQVGWFHEEDAGWVLAQRAEMLAGRKPNTSHTSRNYRKDGSVITCQWYNSALLDSQGKLISLQAQVMDISERVDAEQDLRESEDKFRQLVEQSPNGVLMLDQQGNIVGWNAAQEKIYGLTKTEVLGRPGWEIQLMFMPKALQTPEVQAQLQDLIMKILKTGQSQRLNQVYEGEIYRPDGTQAWVETNAFVVKTREAYISVTLSSDISARKQSERALRANMAQFELVFNSSSDAQVLLRVEPGDHFIIEMVNRSFLEFTQRVMPGAPAPEIGMDRQEYLSAGMQLPKQDVDRELENYRHVVAECRALPYEMEGEIFGKMLALDVSISPVLDPFGRCSHILWSARDVTERKRIQNELYESNQRFSNAFEFAGNGMALTALDGRYLKVNRALCTMLGYSMPELLAKRYQELTHPDDLAADRDIFRPLVDGEVESCQLQKRFIHKNGDLVWVLLDLSMVRADGGQPLYSIAQVSNISDLKRAEDTMRLQRAALENVANAIIITDKSGAIEWVNPAWTVLTGYPADEAIGRNPRILKSGRQGPLYYKNLWDTLLGGDVWTGELVNRRKNGSLYTEAEIITPVQGADGSLAHFVAIKQDISERKRAEDALRRSEEVHRAIIQTAMDGFWMMDMQGQILEVNEAYCRMSGYTRAELLGMRLSDLEVLETSAASIAHIEMVLANGGDRFESRHRRKDGSHFEVEVSVQYRVDDGGRMVTFLQDITERKRARAMIEKRIIALTQPVEAGLVAFEELFNLEEIQNIQDQFALATGVASIITHPDGTAITAPSNFTHLCKDVLGNAGEGCWNCFSSAVPSAGLDPLDGVLVQTCLDGGLWSTGARITVAGQQIATWLIGQVRNEAQSMESMRALAREKGLDEDVFLEAFLQVPVMSLERFETIASALVALASQLSRTAYQNVQQARFIGELQQAEDALRESEKRLHQALAAANGGIWEWDLETNKNIWSEELWKVYRLEPYSCEPSFDAWLQTIHPDDREMVAREVLDAAQNGRRLSLEWRELDQDGLEYWVMARGQALRNAEGQLVRYVGTVLDITERKRAEQALLQSEAGLQEAQRIAQIGSWEWDMLSNTVKWSKEMYRVFDLDPELYDGKPESLLKQIHPEDVEIFSHSMTRNLASGDTSALEYRVIHRDGSIHYLYADGQVSFDETGRPFKSIGTVQDVSERKRVEAELLKVQVELEQRVIDRTSELKRANQALEQAARAKDEFLASMSHELRTPLTGILGLSEALQMVTYGALNDKQRNAIKNIESSGRHLLALINDILDLSKIQAGRFEMQFETCSLGDICQASLQLTRGMANQKHQMVTFSMQPASIILKADARRLKQMLVNLLSNAIKFTPDGGNLGVEVSGSVLEQELRVLVWDDGIGIQLEDQARLFQPFVQLDSSLSRQYAGTGLGLSLVQRLAELHGGCVEIESSVGHGSRFTIVLPWVQVSPQLEPHQKPAPARLRLKPELGQPVEPLVLLVDDNRVVLELLTDFLSSQNYRVIASQNSLEFLQRLDELQADIILMDIQMPGMDGIETIRRIRAHPLARTAILPVIAITALAMAGDRERCLQAGANAYLSKPVQLKELSELMDILLENSTGIHRHALPDGRPEP